MSLYLIQSTFATTPAVLHKLAQLYKRDDQVILMGEALLHAQHTELKMVKQLFALEQERQLIDSALLPHLHFISYAEFADLCLKHQRCISLK